MKKLTTVAIMHVFMLIGCTTIHFDNGDSAKANPASEREVWHSNVALALVEVSDPVDLKQSCGQSNWASVQTQLTFLNGVASFAVNFLGPIWYPKTVTISCE